ncbi:MAG: copper resistance protein CopC [Acetobacteraceae bacterium]
MRYLLLSALLLGPGLAQAHAILVDSEPAAQAQVAPGPTAIVLRYNSRVDHARSRMSLRGPGGETPLPLAPGSPADALASRTELTPGGYVVHWQVLAVDGHITRGDLRFKVQPR